LLGSPTNSSFKLAVRKRETRVKRDFKKIFLSLTFRKREIHIKGIQDLRSLSTNYMR